MSRSRYIYRGGDVVAIYKDGEQVYCAANFEPDAPHCLQIIPDIAPYRSMVDGSIINSRSRHRDHLREHKCIEVGNERGTMKQRPITTPPGLKETIAGIVYDKLRY